MHGIFITITLLSNLHALVPGEKCMHAYKYVCAACKKCACMQTFHAQSDHAANYHLHASTLGE